MASTTSLRRVALTAIRPNRAFHSSARAFVKVGDSIPKLDVLVENSPGNKVNLAEEIARGKSLIIGVPAAFSELISIRLREIASNLSLVWTESSGV